MNSFPQTLLEQIRKVVQCVPSSTLESVIRLLEIEPEYCDYSVLNHKLQHMLPNANWRQATANLLNEWQLNAPNIDGCSIALALATAAHCQISAREELSTELVWTGPNPNLLPLRRTDQTLLQLIKAAQQELLIISFAIYNIPEIVEALNDALKRGVKIRIIAETPDSSDGKIAYGIVSTFGNKFLRQCEILIWPKAKRVQDEQGRFGSLHAKCAVCDEKHVFVSSANLTEYAMSLNIEIGILIHSETVASQVKNQVNSLIMNNYLESMIS